MSDEFLLQLFLKRDKEIKDLVIQTLAQSCLPNCEPTPPQQILDRLENVMSARHENEVKELGIQISGLKSFVNEQKEKIRWLRSQYQGVLNQQKKTYEDRITELQSRKKEQSSSPPPHTLHNELERLRKVADMVPDLIKQFESERESIKKDAEDKCKDQHKQELQKLSQVLKQIKQQVQLLKSESKMSQPEGEKRGQVSQSRVLPTEKEKEKSAEVLHLQYCERLIRQFKQRRRG